MDVVDQLAQPGRVGGTDAGAGNVEGVLGWVPELGVGIGFGGHTHIAHSTGTGIGSNGQRSDTVVYRIEHVLFILRAYRPCRHRKQYDKYYSEIIFHPHTINKRHSGLFIAMNDDFL